MPPDSGKPSLSPVWCWITLVLLAAAGCGPRPIAGGTQGVLTSNGNPLFDVQLTVYAAASGERLGFAVTSGDGTFSLVQADASGPLELESGSYTVTLESVGAPVELPGAYLDLESTPLKFEWAEGDPLQLNVPGLELK